MRKILGATLIATSIASGAFAGVAHTSNATNSIVDNVIDSGYVKLGVFNSTASAPNESSHPSTIGYEIGVGGDGHLNATGNFLIGGAINLGHQNYTLKSIGTDSMYTFGGELHLGWTFFHKVNAYGIIGYYGTVMNATLNGYDYTLTGSGVRYGADIDYAIWKHLSVGIDYTVTDYQNLTTEYSGTNVGSATFNNFGGNIKFRF